MSTHDQPVMPGAVTRRTVLYGAALATGGVLLGGTAAVGGARAASTDEPHVYTRAYWGARNPRRPVQVLDNGPGYIVVHHTATANSNDYSLGHAAALSRAIQNYHMDSNGWNDIGQQLTISRGGHILEGRDTSLTSVRDAQHTVGAHTANYNQQSIGIENEGTYTNAAPPQSLMEALVDVCTWLCAVYNLSPSTAIVGHRDFNATSCPGEQLYRMLPHLRDHVSERLRTQQTEEDVAEDGDGFRGGERSPSPDLPREEQEYVHGPAVGERDWTS